MKVLLVFLIGMGIVFLVVPLVFMLFIKYVEWLYEWLDL